MESAVANSVRVVLGTEDSEFERANASKWHGIDAWQHEAPSELSLLLQVPSHCPTYPINRPKREKICSQFNRSILSLPGGCIVRPGVPGILLYSSHLQSIRYILEEGILQQPPSETISICNEIFTERSQIYCWTYDGGTAPADRKLKTWRD
jgi:hypothetical protein